MHYNNESVNYSSHVVLKVVRRRYTVIVSTKQRGQLEKQGTGNGNGNGNGNGKGPPMVRKMYM